MLRPESARPVIKRLTCAKRAPHSRYLHLQQSVAFSLLSKSGVPVKPYTLITDAGDAAKLAEAPCYSPNTAIELEAQITDAAGRSAIADGGFENSLKGLKHTVSSIEQAGAVLQKMLSSSYSVPHAATGLTARSCHSVRAATAEPSGNEIRVLFFCDRKTDSGGPAILATNSANLTDFDSLRALAVNGGNEKVVYSAVDLEQGLTSGVIGQICSSPVLGIPETTKAAFGQILARVYDGVFLKNALRVEIKVSADNNKLEIVDAAIELDDFGHAGWPIDDDDIQKSNGYDHLHLSEAEAKAAGMVYIKPDAGQDGSRGNIGCFGYGAGLAMATMDAVVSAGGKPANFLDGGGGANAANAKLAVSLLQKDADVSALFINVFGGITQTDQVALGIVDAVRESERLSSGKVPMVVRMRGTGEDKASVTLERSGHLSKVRRIPFIIERDFKAAAARVVEAAKTT